ncbi:hypothetical protein B0A52_01117 [Exophiala mesophila]|uniref:Transcription factor domain-containing protein n=1 Tax=Exophiala mesophila TaxID=212818 RepID=A0A438NGI9_EXOME|nr:hypothetical protein B0A52_01117 [Exophiala mesophila]
MNPSKYLFVNKTSTSNSLSHSNKGERVQIHSHVQRERHHKRLVEGLSRTTQSPPLDRRLLPTRSKYPPPNEHGGLPCNTSSQANLILNGVLSQTQTPPDGNLPLRLSPDREAWTTLPSTVSTQSTQEIPVFPTSAQHIIDPFDASCIRVDEHAHILLQYFLRIHHPNIWHLEKAVRTDKTYDFRYDAISVIQGCLHDKYNMYTLLASMASYMKYVDGMYFAGDGDYYVHLALQASRAHFERQRPVTERMVYNTFQLGCAEWYRNNPDAAYVHLLAAKMMTDALGGLRMLDPPVAELLLTGDAYVSAERQVKPQWSYAEFEDEDDHPMNIHVAQQLQLLLSGHVSSAAGLLLSSHRELVPTDLRWVILDLAVVLGLLQSNYTPSSTSFNTEKPPPDLLHWLHIRTLAIRHRLLSMDLPDPRSHGIRTTLVLFVFMCFTVAGRKRSMKIVAPNLQNHMLSICNDQWRGHEDIQTWIWIVGALASAEGSTTRRFFVTELSKSAIIMVDLNADAIKTALIDLSTLFFYLDSAQQDGMARLAREIYETSIQT